MNKIKNQQEEKKMNANRGHETNRLIERYHATNGTNTLVRAFITFILVALALEIFATSVIAANNPGHDSLYILRGGDNLSGSFNYTGSLTYNGSTVCTPGNALCAASLSAAGGWTNNSQNTTTLLNVGIGRSDARVALDVNGTLLLSNQSYNSSVDTNVNGFAYVPVGTYLYFIDSGNNERKIIGTDPSSVIEIGTGQTVVQNGIKFYSGTKGNFSFISNGSELVRIQALTGYIGVGTTSPVFPIDAVGTIRAINTTAVTPSTGKGIEIRYDQSSDTGQILSYDRSSSTWKNLILESGGGNVGIGTTTPAQTLTVVGSANITGTLYMSGINITGLEIADNTTQATAIGTKATAANCPSGQVVQNTTTGGVQCIATTSGSVTSVTRGYGFNLSGSSITTTGTLDVNITLLNTLYAAASLATLESADNTTQATAIGTKATAANCAAGTVVQNTTTGGVQCVAAGTGSVTSITATTPGLTGGAITTSGSIALNISYTSATYVNRSDWTTIDSYPSACGAGQYVTQVGDTLTCSSPSPLQSTAAGWTNTTTVISSVSGLNVNIDAGVLYVNATNNQVGIGTTTPNATLDVNGGVRIQGGQSACASTNAGELKYQAGYSGTESVLWACMRGAGGSYKWIMVARGNT